MNFLYLPLIKSLVPEADWNEEKEEKLAAFYSLLIETNEKMNLTAVTSPLGAALRHFADSLSLFQNPLFRETLAGKGTVFDIGCGGGFPGIPLAVLSPKTEFVMIDSTEKKIRALKENAEKLGLDSVRPICGRGEELAKPGERMRESGKIVVSRAVARLNVLCELCLPFVKPGGLLFAMKGAMAPEEWREAGGAIRALGGKAEELFPVRWKDADLSSYGEAEREEISDFLRQERYFCVIRKLRPTPGQYPRKWAQIIKNPL